MSRAATAIALVSALVLPLKGCGAIEEPSAVVLGPAVWPPARHSHASR